MKWWMRQMEPQREGWTFASSFNNSPFWKWPTFRGNLLVVSSALHSTRSWITLDNLELFHLRGWRWVVSSWYLKGVGFEVTLAVRCRQTLVKRGCPCQWSWLMLERLWAALSCRLKPSSAPCCSAAPSAQSYLHKTPARRPDSGPRAEV